ncbi:quinoprotein relay system zinc metallohydrolase 2 [Xanthobacter flavus]|uniref:MBL fold metallo-hydrolase n=1 Tax=Xanthobacter flavus TaxID=281 RepID=A0A9W6CEB2_XANFL|nr:quinoprotein relay system zinc metallohydrolase 2 [Xanthobacter flavus]MDR6333535.1 quinoprotein relay system zinc metallohydrolase 2 [Xanthobacter flavus]GLI20713.1 MBL fold metallo-hydrolase [Xanthobacter flavus]
MERSGGHGREPRMVQCVTAGLALAALLAGAIPAAAQAQPEPLAVSEVAPGVFVHQAPYALALPKNLGFVGNAGFVIGKDAVAVIDTGGSKAAGEALKAAIRARTALPIRYVINTHMHPDHVLGDAAFVGPGVTFIGHHNLPEALSARAASYLSATERLIGPAAAEGTRVILPDETVDAVRTIDLGERPLRLEAWRTAHTATDLTVFDEKTSTWFLGDLLFLGHVPALDGKALGWIAILEEMKRRPAARVVPGHGPASAPWPDAAAPTERYLKRLVADVRATVKAGGTMAEAARAAGREEASDWKLFDDFNARNATSAYHELEWE